MLLAWMFGALTVKQVCSHSLCQNWDKPHAFFLSFYTSDSEDIKYMGKNLNAVHLNVNSI